MQRKNYHGGRYRPYRLFGSSGRTRSVSTIKTNYNTTIAGDASGDGRGAVGGIEIDHAGILRPAEGHYDIPCCQEIPDHGASIGGK